MQGVGVARCHQVATGGSVVLGLVYPHGSGCLALESVCLSSFVPHLNLCACLLLTNTARLKEGFHENFILSQHEDLSSLI